MGCGINTISKCRDVDGRDLSNAPPTYERIWLQADAGDGVTWCQHAQDDEDVPYVRADFFADALATIARLTAERDEARASAAAAYERAAQWHDEVAAHDQNGIDYSDAVGVPISNRAQLAESVRQHEYSAREIRALSTEAETTALAEIVDAETRACAEVAEQWHQVTHIRAAIFARIDQRKEAGK